jgi:hypothetical protein
MVKFRAVSPFFFSIMLIELASYCIFLVLKIGEIKWFLCITILCVTLPFLWKVVLIYDDRIVVKYPLLFFTKEVSITDVEKVSVVTFNRIRSIYLYLNKKFILSKSITLDDPMISYEGIVKFFRDKNIPVKWNLEDK